MRALARGLHRSPSTISRQIKDLETRLGFTLCRRGRAGFALTVEGQRIYEETMRLLSAVDAFRSGVDDIHQRMGGQLEIGLFDKTATNPKARIGEAIAAFVERAPEVALQIQIGTINAIERQLIDGSLHVGIIPAHRSSESLAYDLLFDETMLLYCGAGHPLFEGRNAGLDWKGLRAHRFAGLGYHSPNMEASHRAGLKRAATGLDQEAIATLILSGRFLGFLPDHYAQAFEQRGLMKAVLPARFNYACRFVSLLRRSPKPSRAVLAFQACLEKAHA